MASAFLSVSLKHRNHTADSIARMEQVLQSFEIMPFVFVDRYHFSEGDEKIMMEQACRDINACDLLSAEVTYKAIGVGIEMGYAVGIGKPVIYVRQQKADHSTTAAGIATCTVIYDTLDDLEQQLILKVI